MSIFSERIRHLRRAIKKTQEETASLLGISRGMLSNYELGTREPDFVTLCRLADFYCVTTDYLLGRSDIPTDNKESIYYGISKKVANDSMLLSPKSQDSLMEYIELLLIRDRCESEEKANQNKFSNE